MPAPRSFAPLQPALLARKGGARPAMRSQFALASDDLADLGWNDFGHDDAAEPDRVVPINRIGSIAARKDRRSAAEQGRKAAFTLRLDPERHLRLRLASALDARSAQALVTEALDRLFAAMPDLDPLATAATVGRARKPRPKS